jgi:hypothetical protein
MSIFDLFSKRQKRLQGEVSDVYVYDNIPQPLRVQIIHIWNDALGGQDKYHGHDSVISAYKTITQTLCREYGLFTLSGAEKYHVRHYAIELEHFLIQEKATEKIIDAIELSFLVIDRMTRTTSYLYRGNASALADQAIEELNTRFKEHGVGFQYINGKIIRIDSELVHAEVIKPALALLHGSVYAGAQAEFLNAHDHYRHGKAKEALAECLKALESTMKAICDKRRWKYDQNDTCNKLIQVCIDNGLIPTFWTQHFSALRSTLESGVPTARNKLGGHGQGSTIVDVPGYLVAYVLHMTAAGIVFLAEAERALK